MTDFMEWLSLYYIKPYVDSQPKDDGEETDFSLLRNELLPGLWDALDTVNTFYAVQGFRLGLKTGLALREDLRG